MRRLALLAFCLSLLFTSVVALPDTAAAQSTVTYVTQPGDTLAKIAAEPLHLLQREGLPAEPQDQVIQPGIADHLYGCGVQRLAEVYAVDIRA